MYVYYNPNPLGLSVGDCTIRAISCALSIPWEETYTSLVNLGFEMCDMPSSNRVWSELLKLNKFKKYQIPDTCPNCYTIRDFCYDHPRGIYGDMEEMKQELKEMMNETQDVKVKEAIQKVLNEMNK